MGESRDKSQLGRSGVRDVAAIHANLQRVLFGRTVPRPVLGRYKLVRLIGQGAFGSVYEAEDPQLERKVAVKVIHAWAGADAELLLREGRNVAKVVHPNVVAVHEVGTSEDGELFLAMELLEGGTLREWADAAPRTTREIVGKYADAVRGLIAIHASGLAHGDFKADNVLLGSDGRVRVVDFGLSRLAARPASSHEPTVSGSGDTRTQMGGTPLYMAPEQHRGKRADARSDQFSLSASLFEAIYGTPPFRADTYEELVDAIMVGRVDVPEHPKQPVPRWLGRTLLRGLRVDPHDRFLTMEALLDELVRDRRRPWRWGALAATTGIALAAGFALRGPRDYVPALCETSETALAEVWGAERQETLRAAIASTQAPNAEQTWQRIQARADEYLSDWRQRVELTCADPVATEERDQVEAQLRCMRYRLSETDAVLDIIERGGEELLPRATETVWRLTPLSSCLETERGGFLPPVPADPTLAARLDELWREVTRLRALRLTRATREDLAVAEALVARVVEAENAPLEAEARLEYGHFFATLGDYEDALRQFRRAALLATGTGHDRVAAEAWIEVVSMSGAYLADYEGAMRSLPDAERAVARTGDDPRLQSYLQNAVGMVHLAVGKPNEARQRLLRALELKQAALEPDDPDIGGTWNNLGGATVDTGDFDKAATELMKAHDAFTTALGPDNPWCGVPLANLGEVEVLGGKLDQAAAHLTHATALMEATWGPEHPFPAAVGVNRARLALARGALEEATREATTARTRLAAALGADHPYTASASTVLAQVALQRGDTAGALEAAEVAHAIHSSTGQALNRALTLLTTARALAASGSNPARALKVAKDAREALLPLQPGLSAQLRQAEALLDSLTRSAAAR